MSKPTAAVKNKFNRANYDRYEFSVGKDTVLAYKLLEIKKDPTGNLSGLIRKLLCEHFNIAEDEEYVAYHFGVDKDGKTIHVEHDI